MSLKVKGNCQVTLHAAIRRALGIEEGDLLEVKAWNAEIVLRPKVLVDKRQLAFIQEGLDAAEEGDLSEV